MAATFDSWGRVMRRRSLNMKDTYKSKARCFILKIMRNPIISDVKEIKTDLFDTGNLKWNKIK